jgi:hypothetical protein
LFNLTRKYVLIDLRIALVTKETESQETDIIRYGIQIKIDRLFQIIVKFRHYKGRFAIVSNNFFLSKPDVLRYFVFKLTIPPLKVILNYILP